MGNITAILYRYSLQHIHNNNNCFKLGYKHRQKGKLKIKALILLIVIFATTANSFTIDYEPHTYNGFFNPDEFLKWRKIYIEEVSGLDVYRCYNDESKLKEVLITTKKDVFDMTSYSFVIKDVEYHYVLENNHYKQKLPKTPKVSI